MDAVYPLKRGGSNWHDNEIRFSLRSLKKHARNIGRIFVIGHKPDFLEFDDRLIHIPFEDDATPYLNAYRKIRAVCEDDRVSDRFVWMNDDFYLLARFNPDDWLYFHKGDMETLRYIRLDNKTMYRKVVRRTYEALKAREMPTIHYGGHWPFIYEKEKFLAMDFPELDQGDGLLVRCVYGNYYRLPASRMRDRVTKRTGKYLTEVIKDRPVFATYSKVNWPELEKSLTKLYPTATEWEHQECSTRRISATSVFDRPRVFP